DLAVNRQPFGVADRTRCSEISPKDLRQLLRQREIVLALDATTDRNNDLGFREIDSLLCFLKRSLRHHSHVANLNRNVLNGGAATLCSLVRPVSSSLKAREHRGFAI